jgi:hypothetical protein
MQQVLNDTALSEFQKSQPGLYVKSARKPLFNWTFWKKMVVGFWQFQNALRTQYIFSFYKRILAGKAIDRKK